MAHKRYTPKTKIVCTLGPASSSETVLRKMTRAGMDIARINFSHGNHAGHGSKIETVRRLNQKYRRHVTLLADLAGPRVRMGYFKEHKPVLLKKGKTIILSREGKQSAGQLPCDYPGDYRDFKGAEFLYLDDGNIVLKVIRLKEASVACRVVVGGLLKERKAVNFPGARLTFPQVSEKDKRDIEFIVDHGFDFVALSFVRSKRDVLAVREEIGDRLSGYKLISKIENREGIQKIDEIIGVSDGIMVARGDMGVCVPIWEVPLIQKQIIRTCNRRRKLVITATQMLEHMVDYRTPTRAEVTDVANAVLDGTDCVMLSAETAVGKYPVHAVDMMNQIIKHTEQCS